MSKLTLHGNKEHSYINLVTNILMNQLYWRMQEDETANKKGEINYPLPIIGLDDLEVTNNHILTIEDSTAPLNSFTIGKNSIVYLHNNYTGESKTIIVIGKGGKLIQTGQDLPIETITLSSGAYWDFTYQGANYNSRVSEKVKITDIGDFISNNLSDQVPVLGSNLNILDYYFSD